MPRTIESTVYQFDELDERAKERARDWYRESVSYDFADYSAENVIDDAVRMAEILGINIAPRPARLMGGITQHKPAVYWQLHSQGSGACFSGTYYYAKGSCKQIREEAPKDTDLHAIADTLRDLQRPYLYRLQASITASTRGMFATVETTYDGDDYREVDDRTSEDLQDAIRDFMHWIYRALDREFDYQSSDEVVDENIRCNEYEFDADGNRAR